ncbi:MAG TPA: ASCH domain-containing protein [Candidatus Pacearchaeota archaeon]|nr:ASCH domain-containing protein [Candidatus Pacearchaeota archaeon]
MKALSLKQPWAELILQGRKKIELRKWNTHFRGKFLIHASKNPDESAMKKFGFDNLPYGFIVGEAELTDVIDYKEDREQFKKDKDLHLATEDWWEFGFILMNPKRIDKIPYRGNLGFWEFER